MASTSTNPPPFFFDCVHLDQNHLPAASKEASLPAPVESSFAAAMSIQCRVLGIVRTVLRKSIEECELVDLRTGFQDYYSDLELDLEYSDDPEEVQKQMAECCEEIAAMTDDINAVRALFCSHK